MGQNTQAKWGFGSGRRPPDFFDFVEIRHALRQKFHHHCGAITQHKFTYLIFPKSIKLFFVKKYSTNTFN